jgi:hypothetical protein
MNYDTQKYKIWNWKNPMMLHWIINPGLAVNELLLGQRVPKVMLIEKDKSKPLPERSFIPCPHCHTLHSGLKWSVQNKTAFKNWFGLYCDHCGGIIPCLWNATSLVLLALTFPLWYWFKDRWKQRWLEVQQEKFSKPLQLSKPEFVWWKTGLGFGLSMFVGVDLLFPLLDGSGISGIKLLIGIPIWIVVGLAFGRIMKSMSRTANPTPGNKPKAEQA